MPRLYSEIIKKLIAGLLFFALGTSFSSSRDITLDFIGQQVIPHDYAYQNTVVGGLSALDYDTNTNRYVAISDDRSGENPARFYGLTLDYDGSGFQGWQFADMHYMKQPDGTVFPEPGFFGKSYVDPEGMRFAPGARSYFWSSEGHAKKGVNPFVQEMTLEGGYIREFKLPKKYLVGAEKGIRDNMAFEALTVAGDKMSIFVATEGPLIQDGEEADIKSGAVVRLLQFDIKTGQAIHEYVYATEPVQKETLPIGNFSVNGVVDILAVKGSQYIVVERSFSLGVGNSVRLYLIDLAGATDVLGLESLKGTNYKTVAKKLLLDLGELDLTIDNIEGITFGKDLKDGRGSLILVSDNNFSSRQITQILIFGVTGL